MWTQHDTSWTERERKQVRGAPVMSAILLRARGSVASSLGSDSTVLSTSSSLRCSPSSCWNDNKKQRIVVCFFPERRSTFRRHPRSQGAATCVGVCWRFLRPTGASAPGLSAAPFRRSLSRCRRKACLVVLYSREKSLMVLQKSSALVSLTIARE